jgi:glutamate 5-kinase
VRLDLLKNAGRLVVKLGTGVLTDARKQIDLDRMAQLAGQVAALRQAGRQIILVSSGAVAAGMGTLGFERRPGDLSRLQACAAVGQLRLMATYEKLFAKFSLHVGQVLLTHEDLQHHDRHLNARNTLLTLLDCGAIPVINENDTVSFTELKFGDNDRLSALVATLIPADLLVILTTVEGLMENFGSDHSRVISSVAQIDSLVEQWAGGTESETAVGGMATKIQAARIVMRAGIPMVIASGKRKDVLAAVLRGEEVGTVFVPQPLRMKGRKRWIAFFHHPQGTLVVDEGAKKALRENGKSLLPPGIISCAGEFAAGEIIRICDANGTEFARGIAKHSARDIREKLRPRIEVVHRNDLVIL